MTSPLARDAAAAVMAQLKERLTAAQVHLEDPAPPAETDMLRGEIRAYRSLLAWLDPAERPGPRPDPEDRRISKPPNY